MDIIDKPITMSLIARAVGITATGQAHAIEELLRCGFRAEDLDELRRLSLTDVHHLAKWREPLFQVRVRGRELRRALDALAQRRASLELQQEFLYRSASYRMMHALFGVSREHVRNMRAALGLPTEQKRTPLPPEEIREQILRTFRDLSGSMAERYLSLNEHYPHVPMAALWTITRQGAEP